MTSRADAKSPLLRKVEQLWPRAEGGGEGTVVAVSGGPDSVALLHALLALRRRGRPLVIAHLNHHLRGAESDGDETFVRDLPARLVADRYADVRLRCDHLAVGARAPAAGDNLEAVARRLRYDWLAGVARTAGVSVVVTGHTADDQAETVLHRLLRGTGLRGLRGIAGRRPLAPDVEVVRPLLTTT